MNQEPALPPYPPQTPIQPQPTPHHAAPPTHHLQQQTADYPSSPIETAKQGLTAIWQNGRTALGGVVVIGAVLAIAAGVTSAIGFLALLIMFFTGSSALSGSGASAIPSLILDQFPPGIEGVASSLTAIVALMGWVVAIALLVAMFIGTLLQALGLAYASMAVVQGRQAKLGEIMRLAFKRTPHLFLQFLLATVVVAGLVAAPWFLFWGAMSSGLSGLLAFWAGVNIYMLALFITLLIIGSRLVFAPLLVVAEGHGPIKSLGESFKLTKGRIWEIAGAFSLAMIAFLVLELISAPIRAAVNNGVFDVIWALIELAATTTLGFMALAVIAQRFKQAKFAPPEHKVRYGINIGMAAATVVLVFVVASVQSAFVPKPAGLEQLPTLDDSYDTRYLDENGNPLFEDTQPTDQDYNLDDLPDDGTYEEDGLYDYDQSDVNYNYQ